MINFSDELGKRTMDRILTEQVIWLTTISPKGLPQPRPVWFVWDQGDFIIYSTSNARKIAHISANPNISLHFNTDADGYDIQVILGKACVDPTVLPANLNEAYSTKYGAEILTLDMDEEKYSRLYSVGIRITPIRLRGLEPIPDEEQK